jgi:hypothetical protein
MVDGKGKAYLLMPRAAAVYIDFGAASDVSSLHAGTLDRSKPCIENPFYIEIDGLRVEVYSILYLYTMNPWKSPSNVRGESVLITHPQEHSFRL